MQSIRTLTMSDLRNLNRDSLLRLMVIYPWIIALLLRWVLPFMVEGFADQFDLRPYYGILTSFFSIMLMPQIFGCVIGFMLLDERDEGTLTVLQVTPLTLERYLTYKLAVPFIVAVIAVYIFVPVVGLVQLPYAPLLPIALVAALEAPMIALLLASLATNKVQGVAVMKGMSLIFIAPLIAYFTPQPWELLWGIFPTYWPVRAFWALLEGEAWWPYVVVGLAVHLFYLALLWRRFERALSRP
jgi:fluoroquinolone transport system permease protein